MAPAARLEPEDIGVIILAAGSSQRFQGDKRTARLPGGGTLLETSLLQIPSSLRRRLLVLRPGDKALAGQFRAAGWQACFAPDAVRGMGHSLAAAMEAAKEWKAALIGLGDMPFVRPDTWTLLQHALCEADIVVPEYEGRRGNPVGFNHRYFGEIAALEGDQGARGLLRRHADRCRWVAVNDPGTVRDIDTREALAAGQPPS